MPSTPASTQRFTLSAEREWATSILPNSCPTSTAVAISARLIGVMEALAWVTKSSPLTLILRLSTPSRMHRRATLRLSSTPSAISAKLSR